MDPRLYHYQRRTPRLQNPTFKSQFVTDSLHIFKGGSIDSSPNKINKITQSQFKQTFDGRSLPYHPPQISKIRSNFQNNRSKVPLSNLSAYARQIMFPTQKGIQTQAQTYQSRSLNPQKFIKPQLYLDNKQQNYVKQILKMNNQFLTKSRLNQSVDLNSRDPAGKPTVLYNDRDKRYYRYKHSYFDEIQKDSLSNTKSLQNTKSQSLNKSFLPSRLNFVDQLKGII